MITCADLEEFVANYLDGSLPLPKRRELEKHLDDCKACCEFLSVYQRTVWVAKMAMKGASYPPTQVPEAFVRAILGSLRR
jgi:anti-sigma factor RsiW